MRPNRLVVTAAAFAVLAAACGGGPPGGGGGGGGEGIRVGVALDVGGLGDKSFNDAAYRGLQQAIDDGLVAEEDTELLEANQTGSNRDENITTLADQEFDLIVGVGFAFSEHVAKIAPQYAGQDFAIIDGFATCGDPCGLPGIETDNVLDLNFREQEGSFLVGAAAGLTTETQTVGFLGGQQGTGLIERFQAGYEAGVQETCPDCEVLVEYIGDSTQAFVDPTKGEELSSKMYDQGADVVYHAAGQSGLGLFKAAVEVGPEALAIGVDSDQYLTANAAEKPHILTSMLKRVDTATYDTIEAVGNGTFQPGSKVFGLAQNGVDYSKSNEDLMTPFIIDQLERFRQQIVDGEIVVPEAPEEV